MSLSFRTIKAGETTAARKRIYFRMLSSSDGRTPVTGITTGSAGFSLQSSIDGGAWVASSVSTITGWTEVGNGLYYADLADVMVASGTGGKVICSRAKTSASDECEGTTAVVTYDDATAIGNSVWDSLRSAHNVWGSYGQGTLLAADGLDQIYTDAPVGVATTFREMIVQLWRRFYKKSVRDSNNKLLKTYDDDGSSVMTTQSYTDTAGVQTLSDAS